MSVCARNWSVSVRKELECQCVQGIGVSVCARNWSVSVRKELECQCAQKIGHDSAALAIA